MNSHLLTDLKALLKLLRAKSRWTQGAMAKNKLGVTVKPRSPNAVCWCLTGGMRKIAPRNSGRYLNMRQALRNESLCSIEDYNDTNFHYKIVDLIKTVISYQLKP